MTDDKKRHIEIITRGGLVTWQTFDDDPDRKDPKLARILHGTDPDTIAQLHDLQKQGAGVYMMVNEGDGQGRSADNVERARAVFADLDGAPIEPVMRYKPHLVVESSEGKYHAYWIVADCELDQFKPIQKTIADKFDGDPVVHDLPRVMRVPGFLHQKGEPFKTRIIHVADDLTPWNIDDLVKHLDLDLSEKPKKKIKRQATGVSEGGRNASLFASACQCFRAGMTLDDATLFCQTANQTFDPPLDDDEVQTIIQSARNTVESDKSKGKGQEFALDDVEPWEDEVDGAELLDTLTATIQRHCILPDGAAEVIAVWVLNTYCFLANFFLSILLILSPEKRCGKTTLLTLLTLLCNRAISAGNITAAALFRSIEKWQPTILIDEADTFLNGSDDLRGIVNAGHSKSTAFVIRTVGDKHEPKQFNVFSPKAIAQIGKPKDTIVDRSVQIELRRKLPSEIVERIDTKSDFFTDLKRQCQRWADDNFQKVELARPTPLETSNDRTADNFEPLLAITEVIGNGWSERIRKSAKLLNPDDTSETSIGVMLLQDIRTIFNEQGGDRVSSSDMVEALNQMEDRPWPEWRQGKPMTTTQLARQLKKFDIRPNLSRHGKAVDRGYDLKDFRDAFARYTPSKVLHSLQPIKISNLEENQSVTQKESVTVSKPSKNLKSLDCNTCNGLTGGDGVIQTTLDEWGVRHGG